MNHRCPHCHSLFSAPESAVVVACPTCGQNVQLKPEIPEASVIRSEEPIPEHLQKLRDRNDSQRTPTEPKPKSSGGKMGGLVMVAFGFVFFLSMASMEEQNAEFYGLGVIAMGLLIGGMIIAWKNE